jgi:hypothetical protein
MNFFNKIDRILRLEIHYNSGYLEKTPPPKIRNEFGTTEFGIERINGT